MKATLTLLLATGVLTACSISPPRLEAPASTSSEALMTAMGLLGVPYRYGGASPERGFDCSGLVYYVLRQSGAEVPRLTSEQYAQTLPVSSAELRPGDLVFFRTEGYSVSHVGIYLGDEQFIHAPSSGRTVTIERLDVPYWHQRFVRGGRIAQRS
jgi:cell wall-associated NlpC family hydrolase